MYLTSGQEFYHRLCTAREAQDLVSLAALYHPDAVSLSLSTSQVFRGREAILDAFTHTFQIAGAISSRSVESLVEVEGAVCVEATLATRVAQMQTYDIYLLQAGMVKQHVGGLIAPRPPRGQGSLQGWTQTPGGALYQRYCQATEAQDVAQLASLYHPDAISVSCSTNQSHRGRAAIITAYQQVTQHGGYTKLNSVERFVESGEILGAEITQTARLVSPVGPVQHDALTYEVVVLRAGQIGQRFSGLISPRWPELQQAIKQQNDLLFQVQQEQHRMRMHAIESLGFWPRNPWRR